MFACSPSRDAEQARQSERRAHALLDVVAKVDAAEPLDEVDEHPVRRRAVVLEARARLPLQLPLREPRPPTFGVGAVELRASAAFGKPAVCSITCSTVTASLPLAANSGMYVGDAARRRRAGLRRSAATPPTRRSASCTRRCSTRVSFVAAPNVSNATSSPLRATASWHDGSQPLSTSAHARRRAAPRSWSRRRRLGFRRVRPRGTSMSCAGSLPGVAIASCTLRWSRPRARARRVDEHPSGLTRTAHPRGPRPPRRATGRTGPGQSSQAFTFQGKRRTYLLYVPRRTRARPTGAARVQLPRLRLQRRAADVLRRLQAARRTRTTSSSSRPDGQDRGGRHFNLGNERGPPERHRRWCGALLDTDRGDVVRRREARVLDGHVRRRRDDLGARVPLPGKFAAFAAVAAVIYCGAKGATNPSRSRRSWAPPIRSCPSTAAQVQCCGGIRRCRRRLRSHGQLGRAQRLRQASSPTRALGTEVRRRTWQELQTGRRHASSTSSTAAAIRGPVRSRRGARAHHAADQGQRRDLEVLRGGTRRA